MSDPLVEVLTFDGCPHTEAALELVERVVRECGSTAVIRHIDVASGEAAAANRFLGSPTIRVDGRDIEPGADERTEYVLSCRVYRSRTGLQGQPDERWLREALAAAQ